jgi:hypothetical protein
LSTTEPNPFYVPVAPPPEPPPSTQEAETGIHPEDPDDDWASVTPQGRGVRVRVLTGSLLLLAVLAGGFWGGVVAERHHGSGTTVASTAASRFAAAARAAGGSGTGGRFAGLGGAAGGAGAATSGIVTGVVGNTLYVTNASGALVKVSIGASTTITRTGSTTLSGLKTGDTVVVSGSTGSNGSVSATAVRATAQGTPSSAGGGGFSSGQFGAGG